MEGKSGGSDLNREGEEGIEDAMAAKPNSCIRNFENFTYHPGFCPAKIRLNIISNALKKLRKIIEKYHHRLILFFFFFLFAIYIDEVAESIIQIHFHHHRER